jgi:hypothetical protein
MADTQDDTPNGSFTGLPLVLTPLPLDNDYIAPYIRTLHSRFSAALHDLQIAEVFHAYVVGVMMALECMKNDWERRTYLRHVSNAERRIFRREANHLQQRYNDAHKELTASAERLDAKLAELERLRVELMRAGACIPHDHLQARDDNRQYSESDEMFSRMEEWRTVGLRDETDIRAFRRFSLPF